jgi:predicted homoserine dehydrogenase-like protein
MGPLHSGLYNRPRVSRAKTDVKILSRPHNACSAPWHLTPSLQRSISLAKVHLATKNTRQTNRLPGMIPSAFQGGH